MVNFDREAALTVLEIDCLGSNSLKCVNFRAFMSYNHMNYFSGVRHSFRMFKTIKFGSFNFSGVLIKPNLSSVLIS